MELIKNNLKYLKTTFSCISSFLFGLLAIALSFLSWDDLGIISKCHKMAICVSVVLVSVMLSVLWLLFKRKTTLWKQGEKAIHAIYGDVFKIAKKKNEKIIVIPVNTTFDTIVGGRIVSPKSLHGRWLNFITGKGITVPQLNQIIQDSFHNQRIQPSCIQDETQKPEGKRDMYPLGTISIVDHENTHYYLLALSHFDKNMNAHCSSTELLGVVNSLIDFYNRNGQGLPIFIPLMGTGISRVNIAPSESLQITTDLLKLNREKIHGEANVVVYSKLKNEVSIFDL